MVGPKRSPTRRTGRKRRNRSGIRSGAPSELRLGAFLYPGLTPGAIQFRLFEAQMPRVWESFILNHPLPRAYARGYSIPPLRGSNASRVGKLCSQSSIPSPGRPEGPEANRPDREVGIRIRPAMSSEGAPLFNLCNPWPISGSHFGDFCAGFLIEVLPQPESLQRFRQGDAFRIPASLLIIDMNEQVELRLAMLHEQRTLIAG